MTIHDNSILSNRQTEKVNRKLLILKAYDRMEGAFTDREIAGYLGYAEMNQVRPRVTEMIEEGLLVETGSVKDTVTKRTVRICKRLRDYDDLPEFLF